MTNAGVACTQKTNDDASWLQCQKMGKECTHAIECISFFTGIVDIYYSFACLVLPYPGNTGENKPYQWDLPKNKRMKVTVKTKWANFFNWPKSQSAWVLVCALWTGRFVTLGLGFHTLGLGEWVMSSKILPMLIILLISEPGREGRFCFFWLFLSYSNF